MSDDRATALKQAHPLADAIRDVKNANADRSDVVVDLRDAHRMRLELLAAELEPVFADVPKDIDNFDFVISSGLQPRLWIDAVSHVGLGRDRRTFRFVRDTRVGRVVLAESTDAKRIADQVTRYIAERIVERQQMMEGGAEPALAGFARSPVADAEPPLRHRPALPGIMAGFGLLVAGAAIGIAVMAALYWLRLAAVGVIP
ncbi:hypothetical protein N7E70_011035 [Aminobacter sp. NyZ550]|uniref:hypothetical protein n=1 Tax=Aminobacter sp. NyZ550 TaxID=2979870 RepID=UPI0021D5C0A8|nr:hypothetical protein [Aminobacter sp. NyZ550]WAX97342.1 hypothetical protein N7E70_011035 [Aminobacter sp. NyZ550]WMC95656.1 hypothetical protein RAR13_20070 [Aminobacter aminovorans]